jgi:hypothetical protein
MSTNQLAVTGCSAALINGRWQIQYPKGPQSPLDQILDDLERALTRKFYYLAIMMALALPDICACLESPNGNTRGFVGQAYKAWFRANLSIRFSNLTDVDAYQLGCGVMHQGHFGDDPNRNYDRIIFVGQNSNIRYGADVVVTISPTVAFGGMSVEQLRLSGRILHLEADFFAEQSRTPSGLGRPPESTIQMSKQICRTL